MANLAIKGHLTRGKEVIEILEMLGGKNIVYSGKDTFHYYYIDNETGYIRTKLYTDDCWTKLTYNIFTLEEFLEKFPYKVGDKVIIKAKNQEAIIDKIVWCCNTITYWLKYDGIIEGNWRVEHLQPYKEETMGESIDKTNKVIFDTQAQSCDIMNNIIKKYMKEIKIDIPKGYEFAGVDNDKQQVVFEKIGCQYPNTFIEVLNFWHPDRQIEDDYQRCYKKDLIEKFQDLLYARGAYWKIVGEEMGLCKPWEPDLENEELYCIQNYNNQIIKSKTNTAFNKILISQPKKCEILSTIILRI